MDDAAVAQERRHHAGERQHAQRAARNQQDLQRRGRGQSGAPGRTRNRCAPAARSGSTRHTISAYSANTAATPRKPHSSPRAERIRSVCAAGTSCGSPSPIPIPDTPPVANAHSDCASWSPPCTRLSHGRKPHRDALAHRVRNADEVPGDEPGRQQQQARRRHQGAAARNPVQHQEQAREHQRRPHIPLQKEESQRQHYRDQHRERVLHRRNVEPAGERGQPRRASRARGAARPSAARSIRPGTAPAARGSAPPAGTRTG